MSKAEELYDKHSAAESLQELVDDGTLRPQDLAESEFWIRQRLFAALLREVAFSRGMEPKSHMELAEPEPDSHTPLLAHSPLLRDLGSEILRPQPQGCHHPREAGHLGPRGCTTLMLPLLKSTSPPHISEVGTMMLEVGMPKVLILALYTINFLAAFWPATAIE